MLRAERQGEDLGAGAGPANAHRMPSSQHRPRNWRRGRLWRQTWKSRPLPAGCASATWSSSAPFAGAAPGGLAARRHASLQQLLQRCPRVHADARPACYAAPGGPCGPCRQQGQPARAPRAQSAQGQVVRPVLRTPERPGRRGWLHRRRRPPAAGPGQVLVDTVLRPVALHPHPCTTRRGRTTQAWSSTTPACSPAGGVCAGLGMGRSRAGA